MPAITERNTGHGLHQAEYLSEHQYADGRNLGTRIGFYEGNRSGDVPAWNDWVVRQLDLSGKTLLELGGGTGQIWADTKKILPRNCRVAVTDLSAGMVDTARKNIGPDPRFNFGVVDAHAIPFASDTFDAAAAFLMFYHVPRTERPAVYKQLGDVVVPGGRIHATTGSQEHFGELWEALHIFDPEFPCWGKFRPADFNIENGPAEFSEFFEDVKVVPYRDTLRVRDGNDLASYVLSKTPPDVLAPNVETDLRTFMREQVAEHGGIFPITVSEGMIIGTNNK